MKEESFSRFIFSGDLYPDDLRKLLEKIMFYHLRFTLFKR